MGVESKLPELSFDGFVEFLIQYANTLWNGTLTSVEKHLIAIELSERLLSHIKQVNKDKKLMFSLKHFHGNNYLVTGNTEQEELL